MGHAESGSDMSAVYREGVDDDRLKAVTDHVRQWLFPPAEQKVQAEPVKPAKKPTKKKTPTPQVADPQPQQ